MGGRRCARSFVLMADGGVRLKWECGAEKVIRDAIAVDVEFLADHLSDVAHHHRHHLHHGSGQ